MACQAGGVSARQGPCCGREPCPAQRGRQMPGVIEADQPGRRGGLVGDHGQAAVHLVQWLHLRPSGGLGWWSVAVEGAGAVGAGGGGGGIGRSCSIARRLASSSLYPPHKREARPQRQARSWRCLGATRQGEPPAARAGQAPGAPPARGACPKPGPGGRTSAGTGAANGTRRVTRPYAGGHGPALTCAVSISLRFGPICPKGPVTYMSPH